jgi:hypothetical protein
VRRSIATVANQVDLDVLQRSIYSPIPSLPPPADQIWKHRTSGLDHLFDADKQLQYLAELRPYMNEFNEAIERFPDFKLWNGLYQAGDAEALYAVVRTVRPRRLIELGSGYSTYVIAAATERNRSEGNPTNAIAVDPEPRVSLEHVGPNVSFERRDCRAVPIEEFESLQSGDVLFIDTSHAVKLGSEVNWLLLDVLPRLRSGVHVHVHDVFLPYEYPRYLFEFGSYFNEQYLLQALLTENERWDVLLGLAFLFKEKSPELLDAIPSLQEPVPGLEVLPYVPAAFWIRRR